MSPVGIFVDFLACTTDLDVLYWASFPDRADYGAFIQQYPIAIGDVSFWDVRRCFCRDEYKL